MSISEITKYIISNTAIWAPNVQIYAVRNNKGLELRASTSLLLAKRINSMLMRDAKRTNDTNNK
jgi:hypothetical protein